MSETDPKTTPEQNPAGTGGGEENPTPPAASHTQDGQGAATEEELVSIPLKDYKALQSQRDRSNERARAVEAKVIQDMQKDDIKEYLSDPENKKKFPDVTIKDLMSAEDPEDFEQLALQTQERIDQAVQKRLADTQRATAPTLSPDEKAAKLKKLASNPSRESLEQAISLQLQ